MTRLISIEKGGYYAFPDEHLPALASLFASAPEGTKLLDPCAGEGRALDHLAKSLHCTPYANELDTERAAACKTLFGATNAVQGDMFTLRASNNAFGLVWNNPPYSWSTTGDEKRREFGMLKHSLKWVQAGGYLVWCVYAHHVSLEAAAFLARHSDRLDVWQLPGLHLGEYTHVVVVAHMGRPVEDPATVAVNILQAADRGPWPHPPRQDRPS